MRFTELPRVVGIHSPDPRIADAVASRLMSCCYTAVRLGDPIKEAILALDPVVGLSEDQAAVLGLGKVVPTSTLVQTVGWATTLYDHPAIARMATTFRERIFPGIIGETWLADNVTERLLDHDAQLHPDATIEGFGRYVIPDVQTVAEAEALRRWADDVKIVYADDGGKTRDMSILRDLKPDEMIIYSPQGGDHLTDLHAKTEVVFPGLGGIPTRPSGDLS